MKFGQAIEALKEGKKVAREGWNGKRMWLILVKDFTRGKRELGGETLNMYPYIMMKTADNCFVPWLASQTDILAEDYTTIEGGK